MLVYNYSVRNACHIFKEYFAAVCDSFDEPLTWFCFFDQLLQTALAHGYANTGLHHFPHCCIDQVEKKESFSC